MKKPKKQTPAMASQASTVTELQQPSSYPRFSSVVVVVVVEVQRRHSYHLQSSTKPPWRLQVRSSPQQKTAPQRQS
jgi:hypothetical protein